MAVKTDAQLQAYADTNINTNGANAITGALHNTMLTDLIDSKVNVADIIPGSNHEALAATGAGTFSIAQYHNGKQIIAEFVSGTPTLKIGTTVGGDEIMKLETITAVDLIDNNLFIGSLSAAWTLYFTIAGGTINLWVQTANFKS